MWAWVGYVGVYNVNAINSETEKKIATKKLSNLGYTDLGKEIFCIPCLVFLKYI